MPQKKVKKEYLFLVIFVVVVVTTGIILIRYITTIESLVPVSTELMIKPAYLSQEIPPIDKLKTILDNPKFKEMIYNKEFFMPIIVEEKGRPNPFIPFRKETEEEPSQEEPSQED